MVALLGFFGVLTVLTGIGVYITERIDAPRRRAERLARLAEANAA